MIRVIPFVALFLSCSAAVLGGQDSSINPQSGSGSSTRNSALASLPRTDRYEAHVAPSARSGSDYVKNTYYDDQQAGDYVGRLDEQGGRISGINEEETRSENPIERRREFIPEQYLPAERLAPIKDYSHLEPPRVLPSREDLSTFQSREKKSGKRQPSLMDSLRPSNSGPNPGVPRENYSVGLDTREWWRRYPISYKPSRPTDKSDSWEKDSTEEYEEVQPYNDDNKVDTGNNNEDTFAKLLESSTSSDRADPDYLPPFSSIESPTVKTNPSKPDPIYLPAGKQPRNVLYSSLVDMINVAEDLRVKRPSSTLLDDDDQYPGEGLAGDTSIDLTREDFVREDEGEPEEAADGRGQVYPQVARVQDRGVSDGGGDEEEGREDWALPRMGPWDPADTPVATAVLGLVMLFLILVVVVMALRVHCRNSSKQAQEWIRHPMVMVTPSQPAAGAVQPILHHPQAEPIRIKAKGLLERRGSNTSLTLELGPDSLENLVTSRECTPEDFLLTAGNRLSRRALRDSFRDPRLLHAEFWDVPSNHPDRCTVPGSASKNRYRTVLPNEDTRVVLKKETGEAHPSDHYINANYIRGYDGEERAYIATQGPLVHTTSDLWRMVMQERARAVVMITRLKEKGRVKCEPYIPAYSAMYGEVTVTVKQVLEKNGYTIRQIHLKRGDEVHSTLHFWFTSWPDHKTPSSARHLLAMAAEVHATNKEGEGPAVVHCSAGIGRTGCFIGISIGVRQLLEEGAVDVLSIVCQMRLDRGGMVQTAEQYEFIHRALALYEASLPVSSTD